MSFDLGSAHGKIELDTSGVNSALSAASASIGAAEGGFMTLGAAATGLATILAAGVVAAVAAVSGAMAVGVYSSEEWASQLEMLHNLLAMSAEDASNYAAAMNGVGLSVEEGTAGLAMFVRAAENARMQASSQTQAFTDSMASLTESHASAQKDIAEAMTTAQENYAERAKAIWSDLADQKLTIEENLADSIEQMQDNLADNLQNMARTRGLQIDQFARDAAKINSDAADSQAKNTRNETKSLAQLDKDETKALLGARTLEQQAQIRREFEDRRQQIKDDAAERAKEIEEKRKEHQDELETTKRLAKEQFDYQMAQATEHEKKQEEIAERAATRAEARADKAAAKQEAAALRQELREEAAIKRREEREDAAFARQSERMEHSLTRVEANNPFTRALDKLNLSARDATGGLKEAAPLFDEIRNKLNQMPDSLEKSQIILALFGRGGSKFFEFMYQSQASIDRSKQVAAAFGMIMSDADLKKQVEFGHELDRIGMAFLGVRKMIGDELMPYLEKFATEFVDWLIKNGPTLRAIIHDIGATFKEIAVAIQTGDWSKLTGKAKDALDGLWKMVTKWITDNGPELQKQMLTWVDQFWTWLTDPEHGAIVQGMEKLTLLLNAFSAWATDGDTQHTLQQGGETVATTLLTGLENILKSPLVRKVLEKLLPALLEAVAGVAVALANIGGNIAVGMLAGLVKEITSGRLGLALNEFTAALGRGVVSILSDLVWTGAQLAIDIIDGLIKGFDDNADKVKTKLKEIIDAAVQGIRDFLDMHSPSEVFAELGRNMAMGLIQGYGSPQLNLQPVINGWQGGGSSGGMNIHGDVHVHFTGVSAPTTKAEADRSAGLFVQALRGRGGLP